MSSARQAHTRATLTEVAQPHRLTGTGAYPPSNHSSNDHLDRFGSQPPNPFLTPVPGPTHTATRGSYLPPAAAISTVDDMQHDRYANLEGPGQTSSPWLEKQTHEKKRSKWVNSYLCASYSDTVPECS